MQIKVFNLKLHDKSELTKYMKSTKNILYSGLMGFKVCFNVPIIVL